MDHRVAVAGVTGWTGSAVAEAVLRAEDLRLVAGVAREAAGRDVGTALRRDTPAEVAITADPARALAAKPDVWIDYTHPSAVKEHALATIAPDRLHRPVEEILGDPATLGATLAGTQVHSVRLPGYVLSVEALFGLPGERLTIRHDAGLSAEPYVAGTLLAARGVRAATGLVRGLDTLLFG